MTCWAKGEPSVVTEESLANFYLVCIRFATLKTREDFFFWPFVHFFFLAGSGMVRSFVPGLCEVFSILSIF
jgi:hypothetical protein